MLAGILNYSKWLFLTLVLVGLLLAVWLLLRPASVGLAVRSQTAVLNGRSNAQPYLFDLSGDYLMVPLITVGEEIPLLTGTFGDYLPSGESFALSGIPDGLGVYETAENYYVYVNHELSANQSTPLSGTTSDHINGARVSLLVFDKAWQLVGGKNLIEQVLADGESYTLDLSTGDYLDSQGGVLNLVYGPNFSRFCSGHLAVEGFRDFNGEPAPMWFAPEEVGPNGRGWAVYANGTAVVLDGLGRYSKEQIYPASQYRADNNSQTILITTEDSDDGELYLFVGHQTAADPNGFSDGDLYVLRVEDSQGTVFDYETMPEGAALTGRWMAIPDAVALGSGQELSDWVNEPGGSTNFRRPEDIHEDPSQPGTFYFATTGHITPPPGSAVPDNLFGKLYRFTLNPQNPIGAMDFELVLTGGPKTGVSYDNLTVNSAADVILQEDRAGGGVVIMAAQERYARVLAFDPVFDTVSFLFEANQAIIDPGSAGDYGNWESSGIVEVGVDPSTGKSIYLLSVQAHSLSDPNYVQSGQLVLAVPIVDRSYLPSLAAS